MEKNEEVMMVIMLFILYLIKLKYCDDIIEKREKVHLRFD